MSRFAAIQCCYLMVEAHAGRRVAGTVAREKWQKSVVSVVSGRFANDTMMMFGCLFDEIKIS